MKIQTQILNKVTQDEEFVKSLITFPVLYFDDKNIIKLKEIRKEIGFKDEIPKIKSKLNTHDTVTETSLQGLQKRLHNYLNKLLGAIKDYNTSLIPRL